MSELRTRGSALVLVACLVLGGALRAAPDVDLRQGRAVASALAGEGPVRPRLERLRPLPVEALLDLLVSNRVPGAWLGAGASGRRLSPEEREGVRTVLAAAPFRTLQPQLARIAATSTSWPPRVAAMKLLRDAEQPEAIHLLIDLANPLGDSPVVPGFARTVFLETLGRLLSNDTDNVEALRPVLARVPPGLITGVFDVLDAFPAETDLELISVTLGRVPELDPLLLTIAARQASRFDGSYEPSISATIRFYLSRGSESLVSPAARTCGWLHDDGAVPDLIALLDDESPGVRWEAHEALARITDLRFPGDRERWEKWYREELRWWNEDADRQLFDVREGSPEAAALALRIISARRLDRDELARSLVEALPLVEGSRAILICGVLEQLGTGAVRGALAEVSRDHPDESVRSRVTRLLEGMDR